MGNFKSKFVKSFFIGVFSIIAFGCDTNQDTFEEFVKDGEIIYVGKADTVIVGTGHDKLRVWVAINADPKITKGLLRTNDESIMHEFDVNRTKSGKDTITFDLDIPEGEYTFGLFLMDAAGNSSVRKEVPARVYGNNYQSSLINRGLSNIQAYADSAVFNWAEATPNMVSTTIVFEDKEGLMQSVEIPNDQRRTVVIDYQLGGTVKFNSVFKPTAAAIELFEASPSERTFPVEYQLEKSLISALRLAGDASDGCYGSSYAKLTDGKTNEMWHSCEDPVENAEDLYPLVMSFNLGNPANISRFRLDERQDCCGGRSPGAYQIWGTNDISDAETIDIDQVSMEEWEADATGKGWVKLVDISGNTQATFEVVLPENTTTYQYVRIVGIASIDGGLVANFSEFTFWGR